MKRINNLKVSETAVDVRQPFFPDLSLPVAGEECCTPCGGSDSEKCRREMAELEYQMNALADGHGI